MTNLMNEYIKVVKLNMNKFIKMCLDNKYVKKVADDFIDTYIEIRYYGLLETKKGFTVKNKILTETRKLKDKLVEEEQDNKKTKNIELTYIFLDSCIALNEQDENELKNEINLISKLRKEHLNIEETEEYKNHLLDMVLEANSEKEEILNLIKTDKFYLRFVNYPNIVNLKRVILKYNIKFPVIYSNSAILKTFNSGTTAEDKLYIEYYLLTAQIITDIEQSNYHKQYIVDFAESILDKTQKLTRLLEIINNPSIQDRLIIEIDYNTINKYRDKIYELLRNGYIVAAKLDNTFGASEADIQRLAMFQHVLVNKEASYCDLIRKRLNNLIEI